MKKTIVISDIVTTLIHKATTRRNVPQREVIEDGLIRGLAAHPPFTDLAPEARRLLRDAARRWHEPMAKIMNGLIFTYLNVSPGFRYPTLSHHPACSPKPATRTRTPGKPCRTCPNHTWCIKPAQDQFQKELNRRKNGKK